MALNETVPINDFYAGRILGFTMMCLISPFGTFINLVTIVAIARTPKIQTIPNAFVLLLSINDIINYAGNLPVTGANDLTYGGVIKMCPAYAYFSLLFTGVNLMYYSFISINRYVLIVHASKYSMLFNRKTMGGVVFISWLVPSVLLSLPLFHISAKYDFVDDEKRYLCSMTSLDDSSDSNPLMMFILFLSFGFPLGTMCFCYFNIFRVLRRQRKIIEQHTAQHKETTKHGEPTTLKKQIPDEKKKSKKADVKFTKIMMVLFFVFCITYGPNLIAMASPLWHYSSFIGKCCLVLTWTNGVLNSVIFIVLNKQVRDAVWLLFPCLNRHRLVLVKQGDATDQTDGTSITMH
ncbi:unnamed protein product [Owenia fusiformis]|uniref:Uncharacterized protein n=1 Tax=Owenia fusiformis TaxID=6347 RepID=A0A8J1UKR8_OWEFU|nr:unnamed protein product [Owenia fusiformis]